MYKINHMTCGRLAFLYAHEPHKGDPIVREHTFHRDGTPFEIYERLTHCESCGQPLRSANALTPGGPVLRTFDMSNSADMAEFYEHVGSEHFEGEC